LAEKSIDEIGTAARGGERNANGCLMRAAYSVMGAATKDLHLEPRSLGVQRRLRSRQPWAWKMWGNIERYSTWIEGDMDALKLYFHCHQGEGFAKAKNSSSSACTGTSR
jgi:hypothetical protein